MNPPLPLSSELLRAFGDGSVKLERSQQDELERLLATTIDELKAEWPQLSLPPDVFMRYLAEHLPADAEPLDALRELRLKDLALAHACSQGQSAALTIFERTYFNEVDGALRRMRLPTASLDDVKQAMRSRLFVRDGDEAPLIEKYSGRGDLRAWVRVSAVRSALKTARKGAREALTDEDALFDLATPNEDPEVVHLKRIYRAQFKRAFEEAIKALESRDQTLLRQHYVDGLSLDEVANLYQVHRATAARWLAKARELVFDQTRARIMGEVRITEGQLESIMRLVRSGIHLSVRRVLRAESEK